MKKYISSEKIILFSYFILLILGGSLILQIPVLWKGSGNLSYTDTLFTAVSAVCVTGLITLDTAQFSTAGQLVLLFLIQAGGLGIITFSTLYLILPGSRISIRNSKILKEYYVSEVAINPRSIIKNIAGLTFLIEGLGALLLFVAFKRAGQSQPLFNAVFHSVSAFCNAGFSRFSNSMESWVNHWGVNLILIFLILAGGLGFMVIQDLLLKAARPLKLRLRFHSRIVLYMTLILGLSGTLLFYFLESGELFADFTEPQKWLAALFQSVTTRTAGFNSLPEGDFTSSSKALTLLLMLIGGNPGSTAGGIKTTTFFLLMLIVVKGVNETGDMQILKRRIPRDNLSRAAMFLVKAISFLFASVFLISFSEALSGHDIGMTDIIFECFSALGTVGLSTGITSGLNIFSKLVIIVTMFAGRVGLFAMIMPVRQDRLDRLIEYPEGEVLIG